MLRAGLNIATLSLAMLAGSVTISATAPIEPLPPSEIDITHLSKELNWTASDPADLTMVLLFPRVLMEALIVQGGEAESDISAALNVFDPYLVVGVIRGRYDGEGRPTFESAMAIRGSVRAIDTHGTRYASILEPPVEVRAGLGEMQRTLASGLGELGAHTTFCLFPARLADGEPLFPLNRRATLTLELAALGPLPAHRVTWRLPLASLIRDRVCPACGEAFNGAWRFCPWDGTSLEGDVPHRKNR